MKFATAYYLLFFYAAALFKPVLPFFSDFFAHTFSSEYHMATIHKQYGAAHVHKEVREASAHTHENKKTPEVKFSEPVSVHIISQQLYCLTVPENNQPDCFTLFRKPFNPLLQVIIPPPKASPLFI